MEKKELKQLKAILKVNERKSIPWFFKPAIYFSAWILSVVVIFFSKKGIEAEAMHPYFYILILLSVGVLIGFYIIYKQSYESWPVVVKPYLDTQKIKSRVNELENT